MIVNKDFHNVINIFKHCELKHVLKLLSVNTKCNINHSNNNGDNNSNSNSSSNIIKTQQHKKHILSYLDTLKHEIRERHSETDWEHRLLQFQQSIQHEIKNTKKNAFAVSIDLHSVGSSCYFQARLRDSELNIRQEFIPSPSFHKRRVMFQDLTPISRKISSQGFKLFNKSSKNLISCKKNVPSSKFSSSKSVTFCHTTNTNSDSQSNISLSMYANSTNQRLLVNNSQATLQPNNNDNHHQPAHKYQHKLTLTKKSKSIVSQLTFIHGNEKEIKDEIRLYHLEKKEHFLIKLLFPFLFIFTCCNIINFVFKCSIITSLSHLLRINILIIQIKYHIIETSLHISTACFIADDISLVHINEDIYLTLPTIRNLLSISSESFFGYYKEFLSILSENSNERSIKHISEFLYNTTEYAVMEKDYKMISMLSSFDAQLHYFHINSGLLSRNSSFQQCNVKDLYIYRNGSNNVSYAKEEEILMQYLISNVVTFFMDDLDKMISVASKFLDEKIDVAVNKITAFNFALLVYGVLICVGFNVVVFMYKNSLVLLFRKFFLYTLNPKYKKQLDLFREMLFDFNTEKAIKFETNKTSVDVNINTNDESEYVLSKAKQSTTNVHQLFLKKFQRQHKLSDNNLVKSASNDNTMFEPPSNKQQHLNNSSNHSSTAAIALSLCSIRLLITSFLCIMCCLVLHLAIMISHTYCDQINFSNLHHAMRLNFYYTDLIPSHNEILLNHRVGIILNNPYFYQCDYNEYAQACRLP